MALEDASRGIPAGSQLIQGYGDGSFRISGVAYEGSVVVTPGATRAWAVTEASDISVETLGEIAPGILVVGAGPRFVPPPRGLREALKARGVVLEWMDTGAACRTYAVLLSEGREVTAALVAV